MNSLSERSKRTLYLVWPLMGLRLQTFYAFAVEVIQQFDII